MTAVKLAILFPGTHPVDRSGPAVMTIRRASRFANADATRQASAPASAFDDPDWLFELKYDGFRGWRIRSAVWNVCVALVMRIGRPIVGRSGLTGGKPHPARRDRGAGQLCACIHPLRLQHPKPVIFGQRAANAIMATVGLAEKHEAEVYRITH